MRIVLLCLLLVMAKVSLGRCAGSAGEWCGNRRDAPGALLQ